MQNTNSNTTKSWHSGFLATLKPTDSPLTGSKAEESRLRRLAKRKGYRICKSRDRRTHANNRGGYQIVKTTNVVVAGVDYDLSLLEAGAFLENGEVAT